MPLSIVKCIISVKKQEKTRTRRNAVYRAADERVFEMSEMLETVMLICFGLSWPISVYKNIKARSAKGMSLGFILLIILGYAAGISAKIVSGHINYVLIVYILNMAVVLVNLAVYFRNRALDKAAASHPAVKTCNPKGAFSHE